MRTTSGLLEPHYEIFVVDKTDIDFTQANQTTQTLQFTTIPQNTGECVISIANTGSTVTSTGTLDHFNVSIGTTVGGYDYIPVTDLTVSGSSNYVVFPMPIISTQTPLYISFTPVGSGANFSTLSNTIQITVKMIISVPA